MTLQEKVQLVRQKLGDVPVSTKSANTALWATISSLRLIAYSVPTLLGLYFLYKINKNTKRAK